MHYSGVTSIVASSVTKQSRTSPKGISVIKVICQFDSDQQSRYSFVLLCLVRTTTSLDSTRSSAMCLLCERSWDTRKRWKSPFGNFSSYCFDFFSISTSVLWNSMKKSSLSISSISCYVLLKWLILGTLLFVNLENKSCGAVFQISKWSLKVFTWTSSSWSDSLMLKL